MTTAGAILCDGPGGPEVLRWGDVDIPDPGEGQVRIRTTAVGVNRADLLQRRGYYPAPPGASELLGLECAGIIESVGPGVEGWSSGDAVCALLEGGGYSELVLVAASQLLPIAPPLDLVPAAALPEALCTVWSNLFMIAKLTAGERLLVHGVTSGIGLMATQLARARGALVFGTAGTDDKCAFAEQHGATAAIRYRDNDWATELRALTDGAGLDVILDIIGAKYLASNVDLLAAGGRLVVIGLQGGVAGEINLNRLLSRNGALFATSLRARSRSAKAAIVEEVRNQLWADAVAGTISPNVSCTFALRDAAEAHRLLESGGNVGKVVLVS